MLTQLQQEAALQIIQEWLNGNDEKGRIPDETYSSYRGGVIQDNMSFVKVRLLKQLAGLEIDQL